MSRVLQLCLYICCPWVICNRWQMYLVLLLVKCCSFLTVSLRLRTFTVYLSYPVLLRLEYRLICMFVLLCWIVLWEFCVVMKSLCTVMVMYCELRFIYWCWNNIAASWFFHTCFAFSFVLSLCSSVLISLFFSLKVLNERNLKIWVRHLLTLIYEDRVSYL